ncbi:MAG: hypothetical protein ACM3IJ_00160 [Candidatus Levyibacteriota bacterium]
MRQEVIYGIPVIVLLALVIAIASDYCRPLPIPQEIASITIPAPFNTLCYIDSFGPEAPELQVIVEANPSHLGNLIAASATGPIGSPSISESPSPSPEIPET